MYVSYPNYQEFLCNWFRSRSCVAPPQSSRWVSCWNPASASHHERVERAAVQCPWDSSHTIDCILRASDGERPTRPPLCQRHVSFDDGWVKGVFRLTQRLVYNIWVPVDREIGYDEAWPIIRLYRLFSWPLCPESDWLVHMGFSSAFGIIIDGARVENIP